MRKIFLLVIMLCALIVSAAASAAQVTDAKWGLDKNNVLRFVVDLDELTTYNTEVSGNNLILKVDAPLASANIVRTQKVKGDVASTMMVVPSGNATLIKVALKQSITAQDYKSFVLKKDPVTKRPYRIVLDITAGKKAAAPAKNSEKTVVTGSKPVVSNKPTTVKGKEEQVPAPGVVRVDSESPKPVQNVKGKKDSKKESKKTKDDKAIKGSGEYKTDGGLKGKVITLDAGHGGSDPGAIGAKGTKEKDITLKITEKLRNVLEKRGAKVYMTRTEDVDVYGPGASDAQELQARVNVAEKHDSDLFISLHINSSVNKNVGGFTSYYYPKTSSDAKIARTIQDQLTANFGVDDLGIREANFYVVKRCSMPATLLEMCFISNPKEEKLMQSNWFQTKTAKMIANGIEDYFK